MFTGIIQAIGTVKQIQRRERDSRFVFACGGMSLSDMDIGDSIAVNGVCLTLVEKRADTFTADLSRETLDATTFADMKEGTPVNLEKAMRLSSRLNGHIVSGHVDCRGVVVDRDTAGRSVVYTISVRKGLDRFISRKGAITVDGVSLTVNDKNKAGFSVNIIPHTLSQTIFSDYEIDTPVNIEVDLIARYLEQLQRRV